MTSTDHRTTVRTVLRSADFNCPSCVGKIEKRLGRTPGRARRHAAHFSTGRIEVEHDPRGSAGGGAGRGGPQGGLPR